MKKVELQDAKPYAPPKHFNMTALRLHGKEETGTQQFWMGLSHFLPNGGAEMDASPTEKLYFVLKGERVGTWPPSSASRDRPCSSPWGAWPTVQSSGPSKRPRIRIRPRRGSS